MDLRGLLCANHHLGFVVTSALALMALEFSAAPLAQGSREGETERERERERESTRLNPYNP